MRNETTKKTAIQSKRIRLTTDQHSKFTSFCYKKKVRRLGKNGFGGYLKRNLPQI